MIAWPQTVLRSAQGGPLIGFAMPRAPSKVRLLHKVFSPTDLREDGLPYDWRFQVGVGRNLAAVFTAMHEPGRYVIGDPNPNNFLVAPESLVTMVDCDSMQVTDGPTTYLCEVAMPELLPPEFMGKDMTTDRRAVSLDNWALALLLYRCLMRDARPYSGWQGQGNAPELADLARQGLFNQLPASPLRPTKATPPLNILPPKLRNLFVDCFTQGGANPAKRPTARQWLAEFSTLAGQLTACRQDQNHFYANHLQACPWCQLAATTAPASTQTRVRPVPEETPPPGAAPADRPSSRRPASPHPLGKGAGRHPRRRRRRYARTGERGPSSPSSWG